MRRASRRIPDWLVGLALTAAVLALAWVRPAFLETLEARLFDVRLKWLGPGPPAQTVAIVAIDEESITKLGRWPWPRTRLAALVEKLAARGATVIGVSLILSEPEEETGLQALRAAAERFRALGPVKGGEEFLQALHALQASLDHDAALAAAVQQAGNVLLPGFATLEGVRAVVTGGKGAAVPEFAAGSLVTNLRLAADGAAVAPPRALEMTWPLAAFGAAAAGVGHINRLPDGDGISRWEPLLIEHREQYVPHFALAVAARALGISRERVQAVFGEGVRLGPVQIPTDERMCLLVGYYGGGRTFPHYSAFDVLTDKIAASAFQGKIVLIGATAPGIGDVEPTPLDPVFPGVEKHAHIIANIQSGRFLTRPAWSGLYELGATLLAGGLTAVLLPYAGAGLGAAVGLLLFAAVVAGSLVAFAIWGIWLGAVTPGLAVVLAYTAITSRRFLVVEREKAVVEEESDEANKLLGLTFQGKGMLDLAWEKLSRIPVDEEARGLLYNLALDFERKRQPAKALTVYERIAASHRKFRDVAERMKQVQAAMTSGIGPVGGPRRGEATQIMQGVERPTLGRYELVEELGRGAMGIVYRGLDPKINRQVAIKTVHFDDVEESLLPQVKDRFFREAQAAGGLNHPNILTIYDSGEEQDVAWIAMEFLAGKTLEGSCAPGNLLPWSKVLEVCAKVADALDYAHAHGVIHRDIKPANIMLLESGEVKVTDFGIARLVSSSQTKTGTVLGTPSYMSPEQIAGKKVDGRSDLFSLGAVLYEMLAGARPFEGDSLATIMYNITSSPPPPLTERVPRLPPIFQKLVEKALAKDPAQRFQTGEEFARTLRGLKERLDKALAQAARPGGKPAVASPAPADRRA